VCAPSHCNVVHHGGRLPVYRRVQGESQRCATPSAPAERSRVIRSSIADHRWSDADITAKIPSDTAKNDTNRCFCVCSVILCRCPDGTRWYWHATHRSLSIATSASDRPRSVVWMSACPSVSQRVRMLIRCSCVCCMLVCRCERREPPRLQRAAARRPLVVYALPEANRVQAARSTSWQWQSAPIMHQTTQPCCHSSSRTHSSHEATIR
jgi:hypothetical protein